MAEFRWLAAWLLPFTASCVLGNPRELDAGPTPANAAREPDARSATITPWREVGKSVEGRELRVRSVGTGPRRVLWVGGIHGNEREGAIATAELPAAFVAAKLGATVTLTILEDANPDGSALGKRENKRGVDLNRNFPAANFDAARSRFGETPLSQPEARALHDLVKALDPHLVIVAHSWRGKHFINFDGPAEQIARKFSATSGYPLVRSSEFADTPGSLGSWIGRDLRKPILTLEWLHGKDTRAAWEETRAAILQAIGGR